MSIQGRGVTSDKVSLRIGKDVTPLTAMKLIRWRLRLRTIRPFRRDTDGKILVDDSGVAYWVYSHRTKPGRVSFEVERQWPQKMDNDELVSTD